MHLKLLPIFVALTAGHVIRHREGDRSKETELAPEGSFSSKSTDADSPYLFDDAYFSFDAKPSQLEKHGAKGECEKIVKDDNMICMLCKDPKTNGKYEQCSYTHRPKDKVYKFSRSKSFGASPEDESSSRSTARSSDSAEDKSEASSGTSSPDCHEIVRDSMSCTVCKDPKSNGNYEKCTYSHRPKDKVYQFSRSKSFGTNPHSAESTSDDTSDDTSGKGLTTAGSPSTDATERLLSQTTDYSSAEEKSSPYRYDFGSASSFSPSETHEKIVSRTEPFSPDSDSNSDFSFGSRKGEDGLGDESKNESENESEKESEKEPAEFSSDDGPSLKVYDNSKSKEFEKLLQDFNEKDRSKCQRVMKEKMACYKCTDEKGVHKEECMFVGETDTKNRPGEGVAYTELKEYQYEPAESRRAPRHHADFPLEPIAAASAQARTVMYKDDKEVYPSYGAATSAGKQNGKRKKASGDWEDSQKKRRSEKKFGPATITNLDEDTSSQEEVSRKEVEPYEFVAETRPMYDEVLGISLPAYMLTKTEDEIEFDRMVEASRSER